MLASALHQRTALIPAAVSWLGSSPPKGFTSMRDMCVSVSLITPPPPYTSLPSVHPLVPLWALIRRKRYSSVISFLIHSCISRPSYFLPWLPSLQAVCLSPWLDCPTTVFCPRPLPFPPGYHEEALSLCLDPDTNHKGRELNDVISQCSFTHTFPFLCHLNSLTWMAVGHVI